MNKSVIQIEGEIAKSDDEKQIVFGWAYVSHNESGEQLVDKSGEFIPNPVELEDAAYDFVLKSRSGSDQHSKPSVSTMVESVVFSKEKCEAMGIPEGTLPTGWWVGFKVHDTDTWKEYKAGNRPMFSVHGSGLKKRVPNA